MDDANGNCIPDIFSRQARTRPAGVALVYGDTSVTYAELDALSESMAQRLGARGVRNGDVVALVMDRCIEMIVAMLGILKCGAAYMPLDLSNPALRNNFCLDTAKTRLIISDRDCAELAGPHREVSRLRLSDLMPLTAMGAQGPVSPETPAYVMFTSGTTSEPKGVVVPHRAVTRLVVATNYIDVTVDDSILQFSTPSFDASTFEIWGALLNGASLVLYSGGILDPNQFKRHVVEHKISIVWLTAALFHVFADKYVDALRPLRVLLAGGDVLHAEAVRKVLEEVEGITLINGYGPTENTTFTCCHVMTKANKPNSNVPIGQPITGTEVFVLDEQRREVLPGETGELYAAGEGVALGYLNAPANDAAFLLDERYSQRRMYKTGDLVRRNEDGLLEFVGRRDSQVKLRGYRVSLEEIKARLLEIPAVREVAVTCEKSSDGDQLLIAYLQTEEDHPLEIKTVRTYLKERVPRYMIPDKIAIGTTLPVTQNGKVDHKKIFATSFS
jgi:amino acid adenylation domain-containing protein